MTYFATVSKIVPPLGLHESSSVSPAEVQYLASVVHPIYASNIMTSRDALLTQSQSLDKLYDAESMMNVNLSIAKGFVVLLSGTEPRDPSSKGKKSKKKKKNTKDISLAFMALVQGNVMDTCFGVENASRREDTPATRAAKAAKEIIELCATTEKFRSLAVSTYHEAFKVVVEYRTKYEKLNCITRCFKAKKLAIVCEVDLRECFLKLAKAVSEQQ